MFDVHLTAGRSDEPLAANTYLGKVVALFLCFPMLTIVAAILYPDAFGAPLEQICRCPLGHK